MNPSEESVPDDPLESTLYSDPLASIDPDLTTDQPGANTPGANTPGAKAPHASTPGVRTPDDDVEDTVDWDGAPANAAAKSDAELEFSFDADQRALLNQTRDAFSSAWKSGEATPKIQDYLTQDKQDDEVFREFLAAELVRLDIEYRKQRDMPLSIDDYVSQLPEFRSGVQRAFSRSGQSDSQDDSERTQLTQSVDGQSSELLERARDPKARYHPTKLHARGGLGAVYRARDTELNRVVALKEILPKHSDKTHFQEKFLFEAKITGSLEHPGIVPVYGLGRYSDDKPYYAMRFIRGRSFGTLIREFHESSPSARTDKYLTREFRTLLRRLIDSCNAIHFAHKHGVLHRDIKPENIMLGEYGETLVVDWGLAKQVESIEVERPGESTYVAATANDSSKTSQGSVVGTPMYMSPEQALGKVDELDGRTDVYSLGAVLFNLLTGDRPIDGKTSIDVIQNVRRGRTRNVRDVAPHSPPPLVSICHTALSFEPEDRYRTATELADDIDRWLNDELVLAHAKEERVFERVGRFIRRYRSWSVSGAAALVLIAMVTTGAALLVNQARKRERDARLAAKAYKEDAVQRYRDSRQAIDTWLVESSDTLEYFPGTQSVRRRLLDRAIADYRNLSKNASPDPQLELERGRALIRIGDLLQLQNDDDAAQQSYASARQVFGTGKDDPDWGIDFQSEMANVSVREGISLANQNETAEARSRFDQAIGRLSGIVDRNDVDLPRRILATARVNLGELLLEQDDEQAPEILKAALATYESVAESDEEIQLGIARTRDLLGQYYRDRGDLDSAADYLAKSESALQTLTQNEPDHPDYLNALASVYVSQAALDRARGKEGETLAALNQAVEHYRALNEALPGVPRYFENLATALTDLSLAQHEFGKNQLAEASADEASVGLTDIINTYGRSPRFLETYASCQDARGQINLDLSSEPNDALPVAQDLLLQLIQSAGNDNQVMRLFERLAIVQSHLAQSFHRKGEVDAADEKFLEAEKRLESLIEIQGDMPRLVNALAHTHQHHAMLLLDQESPQANEHFRQARELWESLGARRTADHYDRLAWLLASCPVESLRDLDAATGFAEQAVALAPNAPRVKAALAYCRVQANQAADAVSLIRQAEQVRGQLIDRDLFILCMAQSKQRDSESAAISFDKAEEWRKANRPHRPELLRLRDAAQGELSHE